MQAENYIMPVKNDLRKKEAGNQAGLSPKDAGTLNYQANSSVPGEINKYEGEVNPANNHLKGVKIVVERGSEAPGMIQEYVEREDLENYLNDMKGAMKNYMESINKQMEAKLYMESINKQMEAKLAKSNSSIEPWYVEHARILSFGLAFAAPPFLSAWAGHWMGGAEGAAIGLIVGGILDVPLGFVLDLKTKSRNK